jgi:hypothetical protein
VGKFRFTVCVKGAGPHDGSKLFPYDLVAENDRVGRIYGRETESDKSKLL